jgi:hypothetical protein
LQTAEAWTAHKVIISAASAVEVTRLGVHTHANYLLFRTGATNVTALRADPHVRLVRVTAHCRYPTDRAALPPGFTWLVKDASAVPTLGAIDGQPGWSVSKIYTNNDTNLIRVSVPTRFANWLAAQPPSVRRRYQNLKSYSLEINWEQQG